MIGKLLIANRGEIAVRIIRTCGELGVASVAVHSEPDAAARHVRLADESVALGGVSPAESYLDIDKIISAAKETGAEAVHPGYGFLAENADFAQAVLDAGLIWVGPPPKAIDVMGEKVAAREVAHRAQVPGVPGSDGAIGSADEVTAFGEEYGYPVAIKASYGGGGRGMRTVPDAGHAQSAFDAARTEATAAFGRGDVYLERYLSHARHVEVQVFADQHGNVVWLGDRDCSVQRRHQKLVEEAPAPGLSDALRQAMGEASVRLAREVDYVGAGTVEYLVEAADERFYFLEMNTRIQVEHPVTEATLGVDLIAEQLRVASGEPLSFTGSGVAPRGHAIEVRINAENVANGLFLPAPGPLGTVHRPDRAGVRWDSGYDSGDEVAPHYDSMVGKLIAWAPTRTHAISRMQKALEELTITGVPTTAPAAQAVLAQPDFAAAAINTNWLERDIDLPALLPPAGDSVAGSGDLLPDDEPAARDEVWVGERRYVIPFFGAASVPYAAVGDGAVKAAPRRTTTTGGGRRKGKRTSAAGSGQVTSPMQGTVADVNVAEGQSVTTGEVLLIVEAMKMQNPIRAAIDGVVSTLSVKVGDVVASGDDLALITPADGQ
ncbi:acetyl/propionyl/methylcrotonyl-CoA carboxylase subunit alpha [Gordonia rhizosphera]|uniref:biotin carboxylase n=1 Tax=Gordonia rhizosphera NBRC 16068 TaxID=1108045 RepID=K6W793_9ACTN|nr:acetyl-CoA carboxylase biotin carboxylase subunit [Gordonia rhizosphera]GAB89596.1 acyl-CoA carboxylase alpha chain [Gordonia rhizosphera NBRC 16068]